MSAAFDIVQHSLMTLSKEGHLTTEQRALVVAIERTIAEWHDLNHKHQDAINLKPSPGALVGVVETERPFLRPASSAG